MISYLKETLTTETWGRPLEKSWCHSPYSVLNVARLQVGASDGLSKMTILSGWFPTTTASRMWTGWTTSGREEALFSASTINLWLRPSPRLSSKQRTAESLHWSLNESQMNYFNQYQSIKLMKNFIYWNSFFPSTYFRFFPSLKLILEKYFSALTSIKLEFGWSFERISTFLTFFIC